MSCLPGAWFAGHSGNFSSMKKWTPVRRREANPKKKLLASGKYMHLCEDFEFCKNIFKFFHLEVFTSLACMDCKETQSSLASVNWHSPWPQNTLVSTHPTDVECKGKQGWWMGGQICVLYVHLIMLNCASWRIMLCKYIMWANIQVHVPFQATESVTCPVSKFPERFGNCRKCHGSWESLKNAKPLLRIQQRRAKMV